MRERVCKNLLEAQYVFAKTMPENPHWYTLRKTWTGANGDSAFCEAVQFIRDNGYIEMYKGRPYTMYNLNGFKYWTMGAPINLNGKPHTILINRAEIKEAADYDLIANRYDTLFNDEASHDENLEIFEMLKADENCRMLDIGCGTGLFLEYHKPTNYFGIDPSRRMLYRLEGKHGQAKHALCVTKFEDFYDPDGFDLIFSLFGSMNYTDPATLPRVIDMLRPGGRAFLMFYQEYYLPVTYEKCAVAFSHRYRSDYDLTGWTLTNHRDSYVIAEYHKPQ